MLAPAFSLPQVCFSAVACLGLAGFLFGRRRFDWFSVAFLSAVVYFLPGFFGQVLLPRAEGQLGLRYVPIVEGVYPLMIAVLLAIALGAFLFDLSGLERVQMVSRAEGSSWAVYPVLVLALLGLGITVVTVGAPLFTVDKATLLPMLGRWHEVFVAASLLGLVSCWVDRRRLLGAIFAGFLLFDLYLGFRYPIAVATISLFCLWLSAQGRQRLILQRWVVMLPAAVASVFFFIVKRLLASVRAGNWDMALAKAFQPREYWLAISASEPFKTQAILNEVMRRDLHVGLDHLSSLRGSLMFLGPEMGLDVRSFGNEVVSQQLFPDAQAGVASNIWAEMWSTGGWGLVAMTLFFWIVALAGLSCLLRARDPTLKAMSAVLGGYWAFYLHRNDLLYQIILSRRVLMVALLALLVAMLAYSLRYRLRVGDGSSARPHESPP